VDDPAVHWEQADEPALEVDPPGHKVQADAPLTPV
jgi:hypothetical protein